jgi:HAD superfamily hydrolase (TIGR01549 family)
MSSVYTQIKKMKPEWVFFDLFDTIIHRNHSPEEIKYVWAKGIINRLSINYSADELYTIRLEAETYLERTSKFDCEFTYDMLCAEIYTRLFSAPKTKITLEDFSEVALEEELKAEKNSRRFDKTICNLIRQIAKDDKIKIALVSDFYLCGAEIKKWLAEADLDQYFEDIIVSCDYGANKRKGKLYSVALKRLNITTSQNVVMIGDNRHSDYRNAKKCGLNAIHIKVNKDDIRSERKIIEKRLRTIVLENRNISGKEYGNYAFLSYIFIERLYKELVNEGFEVIYFFAREGELLKKLFDRYCLGKGKIIKSEYVYISRAASYTPSLKKIDEEDFSVILGQYPKINIFSFLKSIGLDNEEIHDIFESLGLDENSAESVLAKDILQSLKADDKFCEIYSNIVSTQKELFLKYLNQLGISTQDEKIAVCDVGWRGTIQDNCNLFFESKIPVYGYYMGLTEYKFLENNYKKGLIFSKYPVESKDYDMWSCNSNFWEKIFYASHPSTSSYSDCGGTVYPIFKSFDSEAKLYDTILPIQSGIEKTFHKIVDVFSNSAYDTEDFYDFFLKVYLETVLKASTKSLKLKRIMEEGQYENFGYFVSFGKLMQSKTNLGYLISNPKLILRFLTDSELICDICSSKGILMPVKFINWWKYNKYYMKLKVSPLSRVTAREK